MPQKAPKINIFEKSGALRAPLLDLIISNGSLVLILIHNFQLGEDTELANDTEEDKNKLKLYLLYTHLKKLRNVKLERFVLNILPWDVGKGLA